MPIFLGQRQKIESEWRQNRNFFTGGAFRQRDEREPRSLRIRLLLFFCRSKRAIPLEITFKTELFCIIGLFLVREAH